MNNLFQLNIKQLSTLGMLMLTSLLALLFHVVNQSSWKSLTSDQHTGIQINELFVVNEFPLTEKTKKSIIEGENVPLIKVDVFDDNKIGLLSEKRLRFEDQIEKSVSNQSKSQNLKDMKVGILIRVDQDKIKGLESPHIFFYQLRGQWSMLANGVVLHSGSKGLTYQSIPIPESSKNLFFEISNKHKDRLYAFNYLHGISIRSAKEANWAQRMLPMQYQLPRLIAAIVFVCFALFSLVLAMSMPRYSDLWALSAFCGAMFFAIWVNTPFYWESFRPTANWKLFYCYKLGSHALINILGACLTLSFFRVRGYYLWLILGLVTGWGVFAMASYWPLTTNLPLYKIQANIDSQLVRALWSSQLIIFLYGFYNLFDVHKSYKTQGLKAMLPAMRRRVGEAAVFTVAMSMMVAAYVIALPMQSVTSGPEIFMLFAIAPAAVIFIQFYWMMSASTRFKEKLTPQMDYVDHLVLEFGDKALSESYQGVLAGFDLKGFKRLTSVKHKSARHAAAADAFILNMQARLSKFTAHNRTVFRYKSNGDEWLFALYAKDQTQAESILCDLVAEWYSGEGEGILEGCKADFKATIGDLWTDEDQEVIDYIDLHVMMCVMTNLYINLEDGSSRPDFTSKSFTMLTPAFKVSLADSVAMYEKEAAMVIEKTAMECVFEESGTNIGVVRRDSDEEIGSGAA